MFYKKQNSSILIICLCIIIAGFGFLGGYFVSGYSIGKTYSAKVSSYDKQIAELKKEKKSAESQIKELKTSLAEETKDNDNSSDENNDDENAIEDDDNSSSAYSTTDKNTEDTDTETNNASLSTNNKTPSASPKVNNENTKYLLKINKSNNKPTVYDYTNNKIGEVQSIINIDVNSLSTSDRALLEKGIVINGDEELAKVLEDYSS